MATVTGRLVVISPHTLDAIYRMEGRLAGEPIVTDGNGRYWPIPPEGWEG